MGNFSAQIPPDESFHIVMARAALRGGASIIQLRDKTSTLRDLLPIARAMRVLTWQHEALFLINDRTDLALACDSDGVHLGPDDLSVADARRLLGPHKIIGASCGTPEEAIEAERVGADYIGTGAVFGTGTKSDAGAAIGIDGLKTVTHATELPVAAIGGVGDNNITQLNGSGARMACVISAIAAHSNEDEMSTATRRLLELWKTS
jgi:thiamine-phosphate diphosphorylase